MGEPIEAPKPKYYPETEKPYVPLELTTPNVSYYLPDYKPVNPEVPVVHGLPSAPKPKYEVELIPYEHKNIYTTYYTTTTTTTTTTYTTTTEPYAVSEAYYEVKPKYKEVVYDKPNNPDHHEIPEAPKEYVTKKYDKPTYKPKSYEPKYEESKVDLPEYKVKEHEKTPYEKPKYEEKPVEPTKLPEIYEVPLKEITPGYYKPKEEYKPTEEPKEEYEPKEEPKEEYKPESIEESKEEWKPEEPKAESKETSKEVSKEVSKEASKEEETASEILKPEEKSPEPIKFAEKYEVPEYAKAPPGEIKK